MFARWAVQQWTTVRRETIAAAAAAAERRENFETKIATAARTDNERMVGALLEQARSNAALAGEHARSTTQLVGKLDQLATKLDTLVDWRDRTPAPIDDEEARRRSRRTAPNGIRALSRPGTNHDDE
jgi:hypothetical protein